MMVATLAAAVVPADGAVVNGPTKVGTGGTATFHLSVGGNASYRASIPGGAVDPEFGIVAGEADIEVTVPDTVGSHTLTVNFTYNDGSKETRTWLIEVVRPYVFNATLVNEGDIDVTGLPVKFILDGVVINETTVDLAAGEEGSVEYHHIEGLGNGRHTITVVIDPQGEMVTLSSGTTTMTSDFHIGQADYSLSHWIMGITLVIMAFALVWAYRKPKRNYGRPRGRRR